MCIPCALLVLFVFIINPSTPQPQPLDSKLPAVETEPSAWTRQFVQESRSSCSRLQQGAFSANSSVRLASCSMRNAVLQGDVFLVPSSGHGDTGEFEFVPAMRGKSFMNAGVRPVKVKVVPLTEFASAVASCQGSADPVPMLVTAVSRYGNHWHVVMDSFMGMYSLLKTQGELNSNPTVVFQNERVNHPRRPYERQACCRSSHARDFVSVGPWTPLFKLLTSNKLRTEHWLYSSSAKNAGIELGIGSGSARCFSKVMFGASMALNFYVQAHDEADAATRRQEMQQFFAWLFQKLKLDNPRDAPDSPDGKLRLVLARRTAKRQLVNFEDLRKVATQRADVHVRVTTLQGMSVRDQIILARDTNIWVGMQGTNMFNAMFMNPNSSAAGMVLSCGTDLRNNFWNLLHNGSPGGMVQFQAGDLSRLEADVAEYQASAQSCKASLFKSAHVPLACWTELLDRVVALARRSGSQRSAQSMHEAHQVSPDCFHRNKTIRVANRAVGVQAVAPPASVAMVKAVRSVPESSIVPKLPKPQRPVQVPPLINNPAKIAPPAVSSKVQDLQRGIFSQLYHQTPLAIAMQRRRADLSLWRNRQVVGRH